MAFDNDRNRGFQREMFKGDWKCAKCGAPITELPFKPDPAKMDKLLCRDCHMERVKSFRR